LASGSMVVARAFAAELDKNLVAAGKTAVAMDVSAVKFSSAQTTHTRIDSSQSNFAWSQSSQSSSNFAGAAHTAELSGPVSAPPAESSSLTNLMIVLLLVIIGAGILFFLSGRKSTIVQGEPGTEEQRQFDGPYSSKVIAAGGAEDDPYNMES